MAALLFGSRWLLGRFLVPNVFTSILYAVVPWHLEVPSACYDALQAPREAHASGVSQPACSCSVVKSSRIMLTYNIAPGSLDYPSVSNAWYIDVYSRMATDAVRSENTQSGLEWIAWCDIRTWIVSHPSELIIRRLIVIFWFTTTYVDIGADSVAGAHYKVLLCLNMGGLDYG